MKLSKTSEYALRILIFMAKNPEELYTAKYLIEKLNVSDKYLRRLMTDLSKSGFIRSTQGRDGGYTFAKDIHDIFLYDIIDSVEGMEQLNDCVLGFNECSCSNPCAMHDDWIIIREKLNKVFNQTKLSDLEFDKILRY
ncbi:MAG TPA: Rrf2 family transcriptional regulator [Paludibacteraceae bacterium]|jgi:Rrf2 family protein|nr:Rrf2 family transcriptional regulator [Paludibacteraceae bacterium]HPS11221.1 Rrf2 family transcriptional regulator [Paludibacteraceae bacterium]